MRRPNYFVVSRCLRRSDHFFNHWARFCAEENSVRYRQKGPTRRHRLRARFLCGEIRFDIGRRSRRDVTGCEPLVYPINMETIGSDELKKKKIGDIKFTTDWRRRVFPKKFSSIFKTENDYLNGMRNHQGIYRWIQNARSRVRMSHTAVYGEMLYSVLTLSIAYVERKIYVVDSRK